jgi:hypothetical protein
LWIYDFAREEAVMREVEKMGVLRVMIDMLKMERKAENVEISCGVCGEKSRQRQSYSDVRVNILNNNK